MLKLAVSIQLKALWSRLTRKNLEEIGYGTTSSFWGNA